MKQLKFDFPLVKRKLTYEEWRDADELDVRKIPYQFISKIEDGDWYRSSGGTICLHCEYPYRDHPKVPYVALNILCNGDLVHL
jgi:hypothetical protein